jgi:putative zinc finger/helix-turn-helix YgiT family protein
MICPNCGKRPSHSIEEYRYRECGLDNVYVKGVGIFRCQCGEEYVQLPGVQEVHNQIASELLSKSSLLTGAEFKFLRKWLGLTSEEMAQVLGLTRVTVSRRENQGISSAADRMVRLLAASMKNIRVNAQRLFRTISDKPARDFKIVIDMFKPHRSSATSPREALNTAHLTIDAFNDTITAPQGARQYSENLALVA